MNVAQTILEQLGGNRFIAMTGAKLFINLNDPGTRGGLQFNIGRGATNGANRVVITLNAADLYDVRFYSVRALKFKPLQSFSGVYADKLRAVFTQATGLETSL